ncbi:MAG: hypothetical protein GX482_06195 [Acholeplasmataceae bacterium]|jgi:hypothetical protein|nr:hypothetical protein [Acholeplasmataceae bacterium]
MKLNIVRLVRDFFSDLFGKLSFENLLILLSGIIIGFVLCFLIYLLIVVTSFKKEEKRISVPEVKVEDERIQRLIRSAKIEFMEEASSTTTGQKLNELKNICWNLIHDIARVYFPDSKYPIYELSIDELMTLIHYITDRVDSLFKGPILRPLKKIRISYILKVIDTKRKIDENKAVKTASKLRTPWKVTKTVLNIFNPVYWVRKLMISTTLVAVTNKICGIIIDVVGEETNNVYSKSVFNAERMTNLEIEREILELEQMIDEK